MLLRLPSAIYSLSQKAHLQYYSSLESFQANFYPSPHSPPPPCPLPPQYYLSVFSIPILSLLLRICLRASLPAYFCVLPGVSFLWQGILRFIWGSFLSFPRYFSKTLYMCKMAVLWLMSEIYLNQNVKREE